MRRRAALIGVPAVLVLGLGGALAACADGGGRPGYVAVGAAGTGPSAPDRAVPPQDGVRLVPLDGSAAPPPSGASRPGTDTPSTPPASGGPAGQTPAAPVSPVSPGAPSNAPAPPGRSPSAGSPGTPGAPASPGTPTTPSGTPSGSTGPAPGPAVLSLGAPSRSAGDHRWCEDVTVPFRNSGGTAVKSGTVVFATHIIGLLGVDWATITTSQALPVPIAAGASTSRTYGVCVDAWRVPLGMHVETRSVTASWG
ncbi:hypothetical protein [Streptomyces sp. NPDC001205]